ncbi:MAG: LON peptidase substrate-binding domain-containing protein [Alphaproteobacteria bacterium]|nr:LON peptidase substrate-binding domain-containing protein [Alphaproteobacteria bacterium]
MSSAVPLPQIPPSALPMELPVFPLVGAVLLPQARLPLNIFEPRYLAMIEDALGKGRMIGMIQPSAAEDVAVPPIYSVGCAGRITSFNETDDGRLLIVLTGVCRFRVLSETPTTKLYRAVRPDWSPYLSDLTPEEPEEIDRERLIGLLQIYFRKHGISVDWNVVQNAPDDVLVPTIIMISPFAPNEKQALLEAADFNTRAQMLEALLEMAVMPQGESEADICH